MDQETNLKLTDYTTPSTSKLKCSLVRNGTYKQYSIQTPSTKFLDKVSNFGQSKLHNDNERGGNISRIDSIKRRKQSGFIFIWPQKKSFYYERECTFLMRLASQLLYWINALALFPSGISVPIKQPPWNIVTPLPEPENRDYIIEPDWNSIYQK